MSRVLVPLAEGFEEIEAVTIIDVLRRAGVEVTVAGLEARQVTGSHGITLNTDELLGNVLHTDWDAIVLPGGMPGAQHLEDDADLRRLLQNAAKQNKHIAAICAAPKVLAAAGLLSGKRATSYPGFLKPGQVQYLEEPVVSDGKLTTSRGPGTALKFALALVEKLVGAEQAKQLAERMLIANWGACMQDSP